MKRFIKTLKSKLIFTILILFLFMGALLYLSLSKILPHLIIEQILKKEVKIAKHITADLKKPLLLHDTLALSLILHDNLDMLDEARYLFIQGSEGNILSHTFDEGFPRGLITLNTGAKQSNKIKKFLFNGKETYDIAVPIFEGEWGSLHLGVSLASSQDEIAAFNKVDYHIAAIIFTGLGLGILIFLFLGNALSDRIIRLKNFAVKIGSGNLNDRIDIRTNDEIGNLAASFNMMVSRLKENIQEIKRLNILEERNKIALDLHDDCIQELTDIIRRLELCEKLFRSSSQTAFTELETLQKNTRALLNRTRKIIFNLKSDRGSEFNLLNTLNEYIKNYQKENNININLVSSNSIPSSPSANLESIFYIIKEALINIRKHSLAENVELRLETNHNNELMIDIKDDGKGFDIENASGGQSPGKWGLISMRERANSLGGTFTIESRPQQGTKVSLKIPTR